MVIKIWLVYQDWPFLTSNTNIYQGAQPTLYHFPLSYKNYSFSISPCLLIFLSLVNIMALLSLFYCPCR